MVGCSQTGIIFISVEDTTEQVFRGRTGVGMQTIMRVKNL